MMLYQVCSEPLKVEWFECLDDPGRVTHAGHVKGRRATLWPSRLRFERLTALVKNSRVAVTSVQTSDV